MAVQSAQASAMDTVISAPRCCDESALLSPATLYTDARYDATSHRIVRFSLDG